MTLNTCSEGISYARELENQSAAFYQEAANLFPAEADALRSYAEANKKNVSNVERAYYGVITDAIEGCYAFNLEPEEYTIDAILPEGGSLNDVLAKAVAMEETINRFYLDAAEQSKGLMADVPRSFKMVARKRSERIDELKAKAGS